MQYLEKYSSRVQQLACSGWHHVNRREELLTRWGGGGSGGAEGWSATGDGVKVKSLSRVWLCANPWTVAHQVLCPWDFPGKNTGVGCHFLLQEIFLTWGSNPILLHCRQILYRLPPGKPPSQPIWSLINGFIPTLLYSNHSETVMILVPSKNI